MRFGIKFDQVKLNHGPATRDLLAGIRRVAIALHQRGEWDGHSEIIISPNAIERMAAHGPGSLRRGPDYRDGDA